MEFLKAFYEFDAHENGVCVGFYKLCGSKYSDKTGSTGNFYKHLKRKRNAGTVPSDPESDNDDSYKPTTYDERVNQSITLNLIAKCNLPPSFIEQSGFREFMKVVAQRWKPSSARYLKTRLIPFSYTSIRKKIDQILKGIDVLSVTIDTWTDRWGKAFIGVTDHFMDSDFEPQALLLDFERIKGPYTAENIRSATKEMLEKFRITDKIYRIITDNASNIIKAYRFGLIVDEGDDDD